jgi:amino-acid N-acetyltransferase
VTIRAATTQDFGHVVGLLEAAGLPTAGLPPALGDFYVAEHRGRVVGAVGIERYGASALLRSAVVDPTLQGAGIGRTLVRRILEHARERGIADVFLLTTTAGRYFPRFGFEPITRDDVPGAVRESIEFREACPASAVVMHTVLSGRELPL